MDSFNRKSRFSDKMLFPSEDSTSSSPYPSDSYLDREPIGSFGSVQFGAPPPTAARRSRYPWVAIGGVMSCVVILGVLALRLSPDPERKRLEAEAVSLVMHKFAPVKSKLEQTVWIEHVVKPEILDTAISELRGIDLSICPSNFRQLFVQYIHACEQLREVIEKAIADGAANFARDINAGKWDKLPATISEAYDAYQAAIQRLSAAGRTVEDVASRY